MGMGPEWELEAVECSSMNSRIAATPKMDMVLIALALCWAFHSTTRDQHMSVLGSVATLEGSSALWWGPMPSVCL